MAAVGQTLPSDGRSANDRFQAVSGNPSETSPASAERRNQPFAALGSDWLASGKSDHAPETVIPQRVAQRGDGCAQRQDRHGFHAANHVMAILEPRR